MRKPFVRLSTCGSGAIALLWQDGRNAGESNRQRYFNPIVAYAFRIMGETSLVGGAPSTVPVERATWRLHRSAIIWYPIPVTRGTQMEQRQ